MRAPRVHQAKESPVSEKEPIILELAQYPQVFRVNIHPSEKVDLGIFNCLIVCMIGSVDHLRLLRLTMTLKLHNGAIYINLYNKKTNST